MVWSTKCSSGPPLSILHVLFRQRVSVALQRAETTFILKHTIVVGEGFLPFSSFLSFSLLDMFIVIGGGFET